MTFDPAEWLDNVPTILSANYGQRSTNPPRVIVLHTTEGNEREGSAKSSATWCASGQTVGSAHLFVDNRETWRGVPDVARANHAAGANDFSLGLECAGRASQTAAEWADAFSVAMLDRAAHIVAAWSTRFEIPLVPIGPDELRAGAAGVCQHVDVSRAFGLSDHWDCGDAFPFDALLAHARTIKGDDVLTIKDVENIRRVVREEIAAQWKDGNPDGVGRRAVSESVKRQVLSLFRPVVLKSRKK